MLRALMFLKGGSGSGNFGHRGRPGKVGGSAPAQPERLADDYQPPASAYIATAADARAYWDEHLRGRVLDVAVRQKAVHRLRVHLGDTSHAWTRGARDDDEGPPAGPVVARDGGPRWFSPSRAKLMDRLLPTLQRPYAVKESGDGHVYLHYRLVGGKRYVVVLKPMAGSKGSDWALASAHLRSGDSRESVETAPNAKPGALRKAQTPTLAGRGSEPDDGMTGSYHPTPPGDDARCATPEGHAGLSAGTYVAAFYQLSKALGPSERWITIHPNGADSKGQPILIQQQPDGSAKVIGGAGGSLNHLRLTAVKPQSSLKEVLAQRAKERRERAADQRKRDKEAGIATAKKEAHDRLKDQTREAQRQFVYSVAEAMGWKPEETRFNPPADARDEDLGKLRDAHDKAVLAKARAAVELNRQRLLSDADARAQAEFGDVPLNTTDPDVLSVQDIDPVAQSTGLGFATDYKKRAEAKGATEAVVAAEAAEVKKAPPKPPKPKGREGEIGEGLDLLREPAGPDLKAKLVDAKTALDLMKLDKKRRLAEAEARKARKTINEATEAPKAAVIEVDEARLDKAVAEEMANDLRTISTRAFLSEVGKAASDPVKALGRHVGAGAYNAVNALALAAGGSALVDRSVVDVLGVAGAAEVLARRLHADLSPQDLKDVSDAAEAFHLQHYMGATDDAIARARELKAQAAELEIGSADDGHDLAALQEANRLRAQAVDEAAKIMGQTLGETEANAALVYALKRGRTDKAFEAPLGDMTVEAAIRQLRAIGLQRGDYAIDTVAGQRVATISPAGLDRLSAPVNRADLEQVRQNLAIIGGAQDQDGWLPDGFSDRPDLALDLKPGVAPSLAEPFRPGLDVEQSIRDYIGGRAADGDAPADIVSDLQSAAFFQKVSDKEAYRALLDKLAPLQDPDGKLRPAEALRSDFEKMADAYVSARGGTIAPLHRQSFAIDDHAMDAAHRALAAEPAGIAAYKPVGELSPQDQSALRDWFARNVARESPEAGGLRRELEAMVEPEREVADMFGDAATNPAWSEWKSRRDETAEKLSAASLSWPKYVESMRSPQAAYAAVQDLVQSNVGKAFADSYNTLRPDAPLKLGRSSVRGALNHLDAVDPQAREARLARERAMADRLRDRAGGRYAAGSVRDKLDAAREEDAGLQAAQMGFFADEEEGNRDVRPLAPDERHSLGHAAEQQLAKLIPAIGRNFKADQPVKLFRPSMSGGKNVARQRAIKMLAANKRVALSFGTGSGKTAIGLGAFSHLHAKGEVKKGLFLVPSIAQGGFGADALRFLKPGQFKWHAQPGASREERIAAYKDTNTHFSVVTHQAFRDDMLHLGAQKAGVTPEQMAARVQDMGRAERKAWMADVMAHHGISVDYLNVDEGHGLLDRQGKPDSRLANVVDSVSDNAAYYVNASADPVKNDLSEAFSLLQKMDPERYTDRSAFMRRYAVDTQAAKDELRREMARFQYPSKIDPDVTATRSEVNVPVTGAEKEKLADLDRTFARVRMARMQGGVDVDAVRSLSPEAFKGAPAEQHEAIAREFSKSLGIMKASATRKVLDASGGKLDAVSRIAGERKDKPGVVFAHSLDTVGAIQRRLAEQGFRVTTITGKHTAEEKAAAIRAFNPDNGNRSADIIVCSDAGATGANLQSGRWLCNVDVPDTACTHAQRNGRINRTGQLNDVELIDLVSDHPIERRARARLREKYALRDMMTTPMEQLDDSGIAYFLKQRRLRREAGGAA